MKIKTNGFYRYFLELSDKFENYCAHRRRYNRMVRDIQSIVNDALKEKVNSSVITVECYYKEIFLEVLNKNHFTIVSEEQIANHYRCTFTWEENSMRIKPIRTKSPTIALSKAFRNFFSTIICEIKVHFVYKYLALKIHRAACRGQNMIFTTLKVDTPLGKIMTAILTKQNFTVRTNFLHQLIIYWTEDHV